MSDTQTPARTATLTAAFADPIDRRRVPEFHARTLVDRIVDGALIPGASTPTGSLATATVGSGRAR